MLRANESLEFAQATVDARAATAEQLADTDAYAAALDEQAAAAAENAAIATAAAEEAAQTAAEDCAKIAFDAGLRRIKVLVKGPGNGRESAIRTLHNNGLEVSEIVDVTPVPHNGCRPPKRRRV